MDGSYDETFQDNGTLLFKTVSGQEKLFDLDVYDDGSMLITGGAYSDTSDNDFKLVKLNADGTLDPSFGNNGVVLTDFFNYEDYAYNAGIQDDGKIVAIGSCKDPEKRIAMVRYDESGTIDTSFGDKGKIVSELEGEPAFGGDIVIQDDGKLVIIGEQYIGGSSRMFSMRLNPDGSIDSSFNETGIHKVFNDIAMRSSGYDIALQTDNKILVFGHGSSTFLNIADSLVTDNFVLMGRLNTDGTLDTTFGEHGVVKNNLYEEYYATYMHNNGSSIASEFGSVMTIQPDNKIVFYNTWMSVHMFRILSGIDLPPSVINSILEDANNKLEVFPNPCRDLLTVKCQLPTEIKQVSIELYSLMGKHVGTLKKTAFPLENEINEEIQIPHYAPSGFYYLSVRNSEGDILQMKKILINK
jgi:uncharacterized delta-60 repeat protein